MSRRRAIEVAEVAFGADRVPDVDVAVIPYLVVHVIPHRAP